MSISQFLQQATIWLAWTGLALGLLTLLAFLLRWGVKFRLVGTTIFTFLLAGSCLAFSASYTPPVLQEGAMYVPVVYDNGFDLVIAQAPQNFPEEAIEPTLKQIAGNLKSGGRNGFIVHVRLRKIEPIKTGISSPIIIGELTRDFRENNPPSFPLISNDS